MRILLAGLVGLLSACASEPASDTIVVPSVIDEALAAMVDDGRVIGVTALVYEDGVEAYSASFGLSDREAERAMARDSMFQIFSMTKAVTGAAFLTLHDEGAFSLDDPITDYIPEFADVMVFEGLNEDGEAILVPPRQMPTVRDAMMHMVGLYGGADGTYLGQLYAERDPLNVMAYTTEEAITNLASIPLAYHPGEAWRYSNSMDLQVLMIERITGMAYKDYLQETILDPLEMVDTSYHVEEQDRDRLSGLYQLGQDGVQTRVPNDFTGPVVFGEPRFNPGSWGLVSTADDYMRFALMLQNDGILEGERILSEEAVRLMRTNHLPDNVTERHWLPGKASYKTMGFGLNVAVRVGAPATLEETYGVPGEFYWDGYPSTLFWIDPENDITAVFLVQQLPYNDELHRAFRNAVYNQDRPWARP